jgi:hypothetical protein
MTTFVYVLIFVGLCIALNAWILPKFGIQT